MKKISSNKFNFFCGVYLFLFFVNQIRYIIKGGTTWDDLELINTSQRIIEKFFLFFEDKSNPFLSEFSSNFEYYGYLVLIPAFIFSNLELVNSIFNFIFNDLLSNKILNEVEIEYYLRHIFLNIYLILTLFLTFLLFSKLSNKVSALKFIVILTLVPSFSGHGLFNLKDIPYAMQSLLAVLYSLIIIKNVNNIPKWSSLKLGILFGFLFLIRINGIVILIATVGYSVITQKINYQKLIHMFYFWLKTTLISIIILFIGTPSAWQKPKLWFSGALNTQFNIEWNSYVLTNGNYSLANDIDPFYLIKWINFKMPLIFHFAFIMFIYYIIKNKSFGIIFRNKLLLFSVYFITTVITGFIFLKPVTYDGIRHYLFLIPFFVIFYIELTNEIFQSNKFKNLFFLISLIYLLLTQINLGEYKYIYFNELVDEKNISVACSNIGGCGDWQTDYWGFSGKSLIQAFNSKEIEGTLFTCNPPQVFNTYLNLESNKESTDSIDYILNKDFFYIGYLHRPMLIYDTCGFFEQKIELSCKNLIKAQTKLRNTTINLSYVDICYKN